MTFAVVESFLESKSGESTTNEDFFADGAFWAVACDGATDKSGLDFGGETGGRAIAKVVNDAVSSASAGISASALVERINAACNAVLGDKLETVSVPDLPTCSFVALEKQEGRIVRVGDASWATGMREEIGNKKIDEIHSSFRAAYLDMMLLEGASRESLLREDGGRALILPSLKKQGILRNINEGSLSYGAIDGRPVPERFIESWTLAREEDVVVLASDGYPRLFLTLEETEQYLQRDLLSDPLRMGRHPSTKGVQAGNLSYDDRTYLKLERR